MDEFHIDGFRFDLAVTLCRNAAQRLRSAPPLPRGHRRGPGAVRRQADRRAVGHWLRRLADRALPAGLGGLERPLPRRAAFVLARGPGRDRGRRPRRFRGPARGRHVRLREPLRRIGPFPDGLGSTSSPRTTASRWPTSCPTTASTTRPTESRTATATATTAATTTASKGRTEDEAHPGRCGPRPAATSWPPLMVSMGVPMITAGDELGRTQQGNNNAYCQDNPLAWLDWTSTPESHAMLRSTKRVHPAPQGIPGRPAPRLSRRDEQSYLHWFDEHGKPMSMDRWNDPQHRVVQLLLGSDDGQVDGLVVVNGSAHDMKITLPEISNDDGTGKRLFELRLTTSELHDRRQGVRVAAGERDVVQSTPSASTAPRIRHGECMRRDREAADAGRGCWCWLVGLRHGAFRHAGGPGQSGRFSGASTAAPGPPSTAAAAQSPFRAADRSAVSGLPPEARETLALIARGGPYPYERDDAVFRQL